jgi:hypothetical protein
MNVALGPATSADLLHDKDEQKSPTQWPGLSEAVKPQYGANVPLLS